MKPPCGQSPQPANPPQAPPYEGRGYESIALEDLARFVGNAVLAPSAQELDVEQEEDHAAEAQTRTHQGHDRPSQGSGFNNV